MDDAGRVVVAEFVDCLVDEARARVRRVRDLPSRTGVYFLLAMCLFPRTGYLGVWGKLTAALDGLGVSVPSAKALRDLRHRIGIAPVRALFEVLAGPLDRPGTPGVDIFRVGSAVDGPLKKTCPSSAPVPLDPEKPPALTRTRER